MSSLWCIVTNLYPCHTKRRCHSVCTAFLNHVSALTWRNTPKNIKGLGSLTIIFYPAKNKCFYKELQNITMVIKYNFLTVNKLNYTPLKSILYKKTWLLAMYLCQNSRYFAFLLCLCLKLNKMNQKETHSPFKGMIIWTK